LNPRAATWRDADGRTVATVYGETACRAPRHPRDLAAATDDGGFESIMRCRDCDGCRKYEELLLRRRLAEHYKEVTDELWIVTIEAALEEQSGLCARVRRSRFGAFEPGFYRLGVSSFAMVARGERPELSRVRALGARTIRVEKIGRARRPREFRALVRGQLVARGDYTSWKNRFYHRSLAQLPKETFVVERRGGIRKRHPEAKYGFRAWRQGLTLEAPMLAKMSQIVGDFPAFYDQPSNRKCTHSRCPADRCLYKGREADRQLPINQPARVSAPSYSSMPGFPVAASPDSESRSVTPRRPELASAGAAATFALKTNSNSITGGRDAGSLQVGNAKWRAQLERFASLGKPKPPNST
jgi:hypothetical protein